MPARRASFSFHNHASFVDPAGSVARGVRVALDAGVDLIGLLYHNSSEPFDLFRRQRGRLLGPRYRCEDLDDGLMEVRRPSTGARVLLARTNELTTLEGEVIVVGDTGEVKNCRTAGGEYTADYRNHKPRVLPLARVLELNPALGRDDVLLIAPHPWDEETGLARDEGLGERRFAEELARGCLDAYEEHNGVRALFHRLTTPAWRAPNDEAAGFRARHGRAGITGNDSHAPDLARNTTSVEVDPEAWRGVPLATLKAALRDGRTIRNRKRYPSLTCMFFRGMQSGRNPLVRVVIRSGLMGR